MRRFLFGAMLLFIGLRLCGQSLGAGDLAFVGYVSAGGIHKWTFVLLDTVPGNDTIYFTDQGWISGAWSTGPAEAHLRWVAPTQGVACGTILSIEETTADVFAVEGPGTASIAPGYSGFALSTGGDQILAYAGGSGPEPTTPTFISGIHMNYNASNFNSTTKWGNGSSTGRAESDVPLGLTNGVNCVSLATGPGTEEDNGRLSNVILQTATADVRADLNNVSEWLTTGSNQDISPRVFSLNLDCAPYITWNGGSSTTWHDNGNWSYMGNFPSSSDNMMIPAYTANQPIITNGPRVINSLKIESGAMLTIQPGDELTLNGSLVNNGTIILQADATGIASLLVGVNVSGTGTFQMQQYLTGSGGATPDGRYWYVSSPMASATSNVYSAAGNDRLWSADETTQTYTEITDNATSLPPGTGYIARLGSTSTLTFTGGAFNNGNVSITGLSRTGVTEANRGYNLVGNPYPSTVSWDDATRTNLETTMWYRTHNGSTMLYDTYNATGQVGTNNNGSGAVTGDIPPTQAFWVKVSGDGLTGQLDFTNAMRSHGTLAGIRRVEEESGTVRIRVSDGMTSDEEILLFDPSAIDGFDDFDSHKFWGSAAHPQIYTNIGEDTLTINGMSSMATNPVIDLGLKLPTAGSYSLDATGITLNEPVLLEDRLLNVFQDLNVEPNYAFTSVAGNIGDRFALHLGTMISSVNEATSPDLASIYGLDRTVHIIFSSNQETIGSIRVFTLTGMEVASKMLSGTGGTVDLSGLPSGIYLVTVETGIRKVHRKIVLR